MPGNRRVFSAFRFGSIECVDRYKYWRVETLHHLSRYDIPYGLDRCKKLYLNTRCVNHTFIGLRKLNPVHIIAVLFRLNVAIP
jgi:hypothetical protein